VASAEKGKSIELRGHSARRCRPGAMRGPGACIVGADLAK
jgi:hypothetical protein